MDSKGFTLLETLVSIILSSFIFTVSYSMFSFLYNSKFDYYFLEDFNAYYQLRITLALAEDIYVFDDEITYLYNDNEMSIRYNDNRIYITPGYNLIMYGVNDVFFYEDAYGIYLEYYRNDKFYTVLIHQWIKALFYLILWLFVAL